MPLKRMPHILLLTSTNLACNPRCHKELCLLLEHGYKVSLIAFRLHNWSEPVEASLRARYPDVAFTYLESTRLGNFIPWLTASLLEKAARQIPGWFSKCWLLQALAVSKRSWMLLRALSKYPLHPALVIAHNPPAFYAAWYFSKKRKIPFALDVEDYHPGEVNPLAEQRSVARLMRHLLPQSAYNSYAAPLIRDYSLALAGNNVRGQDLLVQNTFPKTAFHFSSLPVADHPVVELVWFSQVVDYGRGLEWMLPSLDRFPDGSFHLTLIGELRERFLSEELKNRKYISIEPALPQTDLLRRISDFDAGLAIERNDADFNRDLCLTNKIWTYFQAGLYILATPTAAQQQFIKQFPEHGRLSGNNQDSFYELLCFVKRHIEDIRKGKFRRFDSAIAFSWERESTVLLNVWQQLTA